MPFRVNWFLPSNQRNYNRTTPSVWIRCLQLIPFLSDLGISSTINQPDADADIACFVRFQNEQAYQLAQQQKAKGRNILFDLVVNYFDPFFSSTVDRDFGVVTQRQHNETIRMVELADAVICASKFIAERASEHHPNTHYISDSINPRHFHLTKARDDFYRQNLRAVWSGTYQKLSELEPLFPLLRKHDIALTVISRRGWMHRLNHVLNPPSFRFIKWRYQTFPQSILEGEFCLSHRPADDPYNKGHSLFKIGVFMAAGVPALASPIPSYTEVLEKEGGVICHSLDEWDAILKEITYDRKRLVDWSREAQSAIRPYLTTNIVQQYKRLFEEVTRNS